MKKRLLIFIDRKDITNLLKENLKKDFIVSTSPFEQERYKLKDMFVYFKELKNYDLTHTSSFFIPSFMLYLNKVFNRTKYTITLNGVIWEEIRDYIPHRALRNKISIGLLEFFLKKIFINADHIFFVNKWLENEFTRKYPEIERNKLKVCYLPIKDIPLNYIKSDYSIKKKKIHFITITGSKFLKKVEGIQKILSALETFDKLFNFELDIISKKGVYEERIINYINKSTIKDKINYIGEVDDVYSYLSKADLFIYCSNLDVFPRVVQEAKIIGLPAILFYAPFIKETAKNRKSGFFIKDSKEIKKVICYLTKSKDVRKKVGTTARREVLEKLNEKNIFRRYSDGFHKIKFQ